MSNYMDAMKDPRLQSYPIVALKRLNMDEKRNDNPSSTNDDMSFPDFPQNSSLNGLLTPEPSAASDDGSDDGSSVSDVGQPEYEVERIVSYGLNDLGQWVYLLKWKGYPSSTMTWETLDNLTDCNLLLLRYFEGQKPTEEQLKVMRNEIRGSLADYKPYKKLAKGKFCRDKLMEFARSSGINLANLFRDGGRRNCDLTARLNNIRYHHECVLRCLIGMGDMRDPHMFRRAQNYEIALQICQDREQQRDVLAKQEAAINSFERCPIRLENNMDLMPLPDDFQYIMDLIAGRGVILPKDPVVGCECPNGCNGESNCCGEMAGYSFAYDESKRLLLDNKAIYECNSHCPCGEECRNRVVQLGRRIPLCIFKTRDCGWGVRTLRTIKMGDFVCEYLGEVITYSESRERDWEYSKKKLHFLFDLDFDVDKHAKYTIDATRRGNVSRFLNHSCNPNLVVRPIWIDCLDPNLPRLGFFAKHDIGENEELCFDYENLDERPKKEKIRTIHSSRKKSTSECRCQSANCRRWVFHQ